jgi:hypothetical protein
MAIGIEPPTVEFARHAFPAESNLVHNKLGDDFMHCEQT